MFKRHTLFLVLFAVLAFNGFGQTTTYLSDDFEDNNITGWTESTASRWGASTSGKITGTYSLKHTYNNASASNDQISIPFSGLNLSSGPATWKFKVKHGIAPSGNNNWAVFIISDASATNMKPSGTANGYAVGVNYTGTADLVTLWKITAGVATAVITSTINWETDASLALTGVGNIEVTRTAAGGFVLKIDKNNDGTFDYTSSETVNTDFTTCSFFGVYYKYSASGDLLLWVDDITVTQVTSTPDIAISSFPVIAGNVNQDSDNNMIYGIQCAVTTANATLNSITVTSAGSYSASDIKATGFKLWYSTDNIFNSGTDVNIQSIAAVGSGGSLAFTGLTQSINNGASGYFFITADIALSATAGNTINIEPTAFANIVFASGNKSGTPPVAAGGTQTIQAVPLLSVTPTTLVFGNIVSGSSSGEQSYSLSGTNLTEAPGNIVLTAPTGFQVSLTSGSGFASSINVPYATATLSITTIYVVFAPGSTGAASGNITNAGGGATIKNVAVSGFGIETQPENQASAVTFSSVTSSGFTVNWIRGNGASSIVLIKSGSAVNSDPVDGTFYTANTAFLSGTEIGTGNYVVSISNSNTVNVTGLSQGTTYHVAVYTFNGSDGTENYLTPGATGSQLTTVPPATLLLEDNFNYTNGAKLTDNGWTAHSGSGTQPISVGTSNGLTFLDYGPVASGNAAKVNNNGEDVNRTFTQQTSGTVYVAFLISADKAATGGEYLLHLSKSSFAVSDFKGRVYIKQNDASTFYFGVSKAGNAVAYTPTTYNYNTTYLVVMKYTIVSGTNNDEVRLHIYLTGQDFTSEPETYTISAATNETDVENLGAFAMRQASTSYGITIDALRISTGWFGENGALPVELTSFTARTVGNAVTLNWETKTEVDNNGFDVERNSTGTWQKIGFVEGHGTANSPKYYNFTDKSVTGNKIQYRLRQVDNDGSFEYSNVVEVELAPTTFALDQNYPNPFNPATVIRFSLPTSSVVTLNVYNTLGEKVATLLNGPMESGYHQVSFDAANLPSGLYLYEVKAGEFSSIKKMILMK